MKTNIKITIITRDIENAIKNFSAGSVCGLRIILVTIRLHYLSCRQLCRHLCLCIVISVLCKALSKADLRTSGKQSASWKPISFKIVILGALSACQQVFNSMLFPDFVMQKTPQNLNACERVQAHVHDKKRTTRMKNVKCCRGV